MYSGITYKRFYKYIKKINDDDFTNTIYEEWNEKFGYTEQKFDSIIDYWQVKTDADAYNLYQIYLNKLYAENMPYEIWQYFYQETHHESSIDEKIAIIKRYIDENYVSWDEYKTTLQNIRMEEIDPMCYNFHKFIVDCKKAL